MSQSQSPEPDEQPSQPQSPEVAMADQPVRVRRPGWKSPLFTPPPSSDDAPTDAGIDASPGSPESSAPRPGPSETKTGSSRASSPADRKVITEAVAAGVVTATTIAHEFGARDEYSQALGLYLADEQDIEGISKPAASLAARRGGDMLGAANPDVADGIALLVALFGYGAKQLAKIMAARRMRTRGDSVDGFQTEHTPDEATDPAAA